MFPDRPMFHNVRRKFGILGNAPSGEVMYVSTPVPMVENEGGGGQSNSLPEDLKPRTNFIESWIWEQLNKLVTFLVSHEA